MLLGFFKSTVMNSTPLGTKLFVVMATKNLFAYSGRGSKVTFLITMSVRVSVKLS